MAQRHHVRIPFRARQPLAKAPGQDHPRPVTGSIFPSVLEVKQPSASGIATPPKPMVSTPKGAAKEQHLLGTEHSLGSYVSYAFVRGKCHEAADSISHVTVEGSHGRVMNSGEHVVATPLIKSGFAKPGRAQKSILLLSANVDPCARHTLINTNSYKYPANDRIYIPWGQSVALVTIKFTAIGVNVGTAIWATGAQRNSIFSSDDSLCKWANERFVTLHQSSSEADKELLIFRGIDVGGEENCFSIEVENTGDRQIQVLAELEILFLAN